MWITEGRDGRVCVTKRGGEKREADVVVVVVHGTPTLLLSLSHSLLLTEEGRMVTTILLSGNGQGMTPPG